VTIDGCGLVIGFVGSYRSQLQVTIALSLIHISAVHYCTYLVFSVCYVFFSRCLVMDPNNVFCFGTQVLTGWRLPITNSLSKLYYDRRSDGQCVLVSSLHLGPKTRFLLLSGSWQVCWCGAPTLMRGRVFRLELLLALASSVILGSESRETHYHILLYQIQDSPNLEGQVPIFISSRKRVAQLYLQALGSFRRLLRIAGLKHFPASPLARWQLPSNGCCLVCFTVVA
jgi:hypothetical protein